VNGDMGSVIVSVQSATVVWGTGGKD
jgi:hypothetical protein